MAGTDRRSSSRHLGLDLGGTNIKVVVLEHDVDGWRVLHRDQVATPAADGPDRVVARLAEVGAEAIGRCPGVSSVGIGIPGLYDPATGTTRFLVNIPGAWAGHPVAGPVGEALGCPVALINDARAFGLAELRLGAGRGASAMVGLTLGTGVGGVIAIDGRVHQGHDGTGGELGHQTLDPDGPTCGCGNRGCLEAYARADRIAEACGTATVEEAMTRAHSGDAQALAGFERVGRYLGVGIANMITVITPDRVVIGGGVAAAADLLLETIRDEVRRHVFTTSLDGVEIVPAELGTWAGAIGAAIHGAEQAERRLASAASGSTVVR
ncbi:MAG TPA: ROK family protein [Candidatus Limnocylindrales bacterium]|nr:ROK family protein [Candidatus Limnocylindrales bacterium]